jgi:hypothetical protein
MTGIIVCVAKAEMDFYVADECNLAWCDGLGMLIIIVALVYFGLLYYFIIKKHCGTALYNNVLKPVHRYSNILLEHRYTTMTFCRLSHYLGLCMISFHSLSNHLISCQVCKDIP